MAPAIPSERLEAMVVFMTSSGWPRVVTSNMLRPAPTARCVSGVLPVILHVSSVSIYCACRAIATQRRSLPSLVHAHLLLSAVPLHLRLSSALRDRENLRNKFENLTGFFSSFAGPSWPSVAGADMLSNCRLLRGPDQGSSSSLRLSSLHQPHRLQEARTSNVLRAVYLLSKRSVSEAYRACFWTHAFVERRSFRKQEHNKSHNARRENRQTMLYRVQYGRIVAEVGLLLAGLLIHFPKQDNSAYLWLCRAEFGARLRRAYVGFGGSVLVNASDSVLGPGVFLVPAIGRFGTFGEMQELWMSLMSLLGIAEELIWLRGRALRAVTC